jgi:hypothetical protein
MVVNVLDTRTSGRGRNGEPDFHSGPRTNGTHISTAEPALRRSPTGFATRSCMTGKSQVQDLRQ